MLVRRAYVYYMQRHVRWFRNNARQAARLQQEVLFTKLRREADSDFGRDHKFSSIRDLRDFRRQVPIATYEYYRPYVDRVKKGDTRALFGPTTKLLMFAMTSGTTSESKYIPITNHFFREYRRSWKVWGARTYFDHPELQWRKALQFSSDWQHTRTEGGIPCGNISGLAAESRPFITNYVFCLPNELNKVTHSHSKQYTALRLALPLRNVGIIITANPLTLLSLARLGDRCQEQLIRDIFDGTLSDHVEVPSQVRQHLHRRIHTAKRSRARELERIVETHGHLWPRDYWPKMSVLAVWTGGTVGAYLSRVSDYYGHVSFRDHGLSATEGRMTTPLTDGTSAGILDVATHYFEFIPEEEHGAADPTVLQAHELQRDHNYYLVLTTSSGIYRHDIHDVVRCVGYEGQAPVLEFLNKGAHYSSMAGEKLSEFQVVTAIQKSLADLKMDIEHFTLAPAFGDPASYKLLIETAMDEGSKRRLAESVDDYLSTANCEYEDRLKTGRLGPSSVVEIPRGSWQALREQALSRPGASFEQFKHPFLTNKPRFLEEILEVADQKRAIQGQIRPAAVGVASKENS